MQNHIVLIGKDSRALNLSLMASHMKLPYVSIVFDPAAARKRQLKGEMVVYGDAMNEPILRKAHVETAEIVVISIGDAISTMGIIEKVRQISSHTYIIARAKHVTDIEDLYQVGADQVIPEEFETAIDLFERVLKKLLIPKGEIEEAISRIRDDNYGIFRERNEDEVFTLSSEIPNLEVVALKAEKYALFPGNSLKEIHLRKNFGLTVVAVKRKDGVYENPGSGFVFENEDILYVMGAPEKIAILTKISQSAEKSRL
jgi:CPA2 family monovalent cation:H+ antiporter-2